MMWRLPGALLFWLGDKEATGLDMSDDASEARLRCEPEGVMNPGWSAATFEGLW
jgi:hypothetical protein